VDGSDLREAIFGSFDGMTSTLGAVAGLLATNATAPKILAAAIGIALAATVGMGARQYLSDGAGNKRKAAVMALATLIGSVLIGDSIRVRRLAGRDDAETSGAIYGPRGLPSCSPRRG
jgi:hypothetical protein